MTDPNSNCPVCLVLLYYAAEEGVAYFATAAIVSTVIIYNATSRNTSTTFDQPTLASDNTRVTNGTSRVAPAIVNNNKSIKPESGKGADDKKDNTYNRVKPRKETRQKVADKQPKNEDGQMLDPNTGQVLDPQRTDLGHVPGQEWSTRKKQHQEKGSTRQEVIQAENNPDLCHYEDRKENRSHKHEKKPKQ